MGCSNFVSSYDYHQLFVSRGPDPRYSRENATWKPVPSDPRYEEKLVQNQVDGRITRMTRPIGPNYTSDYPHFTETYDEFGEKNLFYPDLNNKQEPTLYDAHYSPSKHSNRTGFHKTAQSIIDDLDEAINSMRSGRK